MKVFNASLEGSIKNSPLTHLSTSLSTAAARIEGMFALKERCGFNRGGSISVLDEFNRTIKTKNLEDYLSDFCTHARKFKIYEYVITTKRPLLLVDLWEDDPIGSGGPKVLEQSGLPKRELEKAQALFKPFKDVIYPPHIVGTMTRREIKSIQRSYSQNTIFSKEFKKRKSRYKKINEDFKDIKFSEVVWLDYTLKLREWALRMGYDSFVYKNHKEGNGEDTYVTLLPDQLSITGTTLSFDEQKYLQEMPEIIRQIITKHNSQHSQRSNYQPEVFNLLWGKRNPAPYWR